MAASSLASSPRANNDCDLDELDSLECDEEMGYYGQASDEDTEDASETDMVKREEEFTKMKEQMYKDKLAQLRKQLVQLNEGTLPEYQKRLRKIEQQYKERQRVNLIWKQYEMDYVEKKYIKGKKEAVRDFNQKKVDLKDGVIGEMEEKKKQIDHERIALELTGDSMDMKPIITRKLRRRPNEPLPIIEKRRKASPTPQLNLTLLDNEILEDIRIINKVSGKPISKKNHSTHTASVDNLYDARIDDGKLYFEKRWFQKNQPVYIESKDSGKISGVLVSIGQQEVWIRRIVDGSKFRVYVTQLQKGKYTIRRRSV